MAANALIADKHDHYVMLVEDDSTIANMYRFGLEQDGFRVDVVPDAVRLFRALKDEVPDIVVLDYMLPDMKGDEILEHLRRNDRTRTLPVFVLSSYPVSQDQAIDRAFKAGALAWLDKLKTPPFDLARRLSEVLTGR